MSTTALLDELSTLCQRHLDAQRPRLTATPVTRGDRGADFIERVRGFDGPRITAWLAKAHELDPGFLQASSRSAATRSRSRRRNTTAACARRASRCAAAWTC